MGTPGVGFWRGSCPENKSHRDHENDGLPGFKQKNLKFQLLIYKGVNISDKQQCLTMQSVDDRLRQNVCVASLAIIIY
jgi:hypothetical protein